MTITEKLKAKRKQRGLKKEYSDQLTIWYRSRNALFVIKSTKDSRHWRMLTAYSFQHS